MNQRACYPGSFDPLTVAHVAIIDAAYSQCGLTSLDCVLSRVALAKESGHASSLAARVRDIELLARDGRPWLRAVVTDAQLLADIASGYDVVVMGSDKWQQVLDPSFYGGSLASRDAAVARLPRVAVAPRGGSPGALERAIELYLPEWVRDVSSTAVRAGAHHWRAVGPASSRPRTRQRPE